MIPDKMEKAFNDQIKHELESAYIYLSMSAWMEKEGYAGMAAWFKAQTMEEMVHAMKFFDHINERGGKVVLQDLKQLKTEWSSPLEAFEDAVEHEEFISGKIHELMELAQEEKDYPSMPMLHWFVEEQVEEEDTANGVTDRIRMVGDSGNGLLMIDRELGARTFNLPAQEEEE